MRIIVCHFSFCYLRTMNFLISLNIICKWDIHWLYCNLYFVEYGSLQIWGYTEVNILVLVYVLYLSISLRYISRSEIIQEWHLKFHNTSLTFNLAILPRAWECFLLSPGQPDLSVFAIFCLVFCNLHWFKCEVKHFFPPLFMPLEHCC